MKGGNSTMDQQKIGTFLQVLRKEKGLTQEQLAEYLNTSRRTISRWETGRNMPDLDLLIELSDYYDVELRELLDGERKSEKMNNELEEAVLKAANYSNEIKLRLMKRLHILSWIGVVSFIIYLIFTMTGLADSGFTKIIAEFSHGFSFAMLIMGVLFTSNVIVKVNTFKKRIFQQK